MPIRLGSSSSGARDSGGGISDITIATTVVAVAPLGAVDRTGAAPLPTSAKKATSPARAASSARARLLGCRKGNRPKR
jgi:hypothetical protein